MREERQEQVQPPPTRIEQWRPLLTAQGFTTYEAHVNVFDGVGFERPIGPRFQHIELLENRTTPGTFQVKLGIVASPPWDDPPETYIILTGDLSPHGVVVEPSSYRTVWRAEESPVAWVHFTEAGAPWLATFSQADTLIAFYETAFREGLPSLSAYPLPPAGVSRWLTRALAMFFPQTLARSRPARLPQAYHMWLAMLYAELGQTDRACHYARVFCCGRTPRDPTRERVKHYFQSLGCQIGNKDGTP